MMQNMCGGILLRKLIRCDSGSHIQSHQRAAAPAIHPAAQANQL